MVNSQIISPADLDFSVLALEPRLSDLPIPIESLRVLNLGAGNGDGEDWSFSAQIQNLPFKRLVNVEIHPDALFQLSNNHFESTNVEFINDDMLEYVRTCYDNEFDVCLIIDALEHLEREKAYELLVRLKDIVKYRTIIWLPLGETPQNEYGGNVWQEHKSTWTPEDFHGIPKIEVVWKHFHIAGTPEAGFVTYNYDNTNRSARYCPRRLCR